MALGKLVTETHTLSYPKGLINPEDLINFFPFPAFLRQWNAMGLSDLDLDALKILVMLDPKRGPVMKGTGGLRKIRFAPPGWNVGKSGALRIGYSYSEEQSIVLLIAAYAKHDKANLSPRERAEIKRVLRSAWDRLRE